MVLLACEGESTNRIDYKMIEERSGIVSDPIELSCGTRAEL